MMQIHQTTLTLLTITGAQALDPIRVIAVNDAPGKGQIIITCYGRAWTAYWSGMGTRTVEQFFVRSQADYLLDRLFIEGLKKKEKADRAYLTRIILAVQSGLLQQAREAQP